MSGPAQTYGVFIVRFAGALATKSGKTRSAFSRVLRRHILAAMARADLRPPRLFARGHMPGALNRAPDELLARLGELDKRRTYVLNCSFGTVSAQLAEVMQ